MSHTVAPAIETACQFEEKVNRVRAPDLLRLAGVGEFDGHINIRSSGFERCGHRYGCAASIVKMPGPSEKRFRDTTFYHIFYLNFDRT